MTQSSLPERPPIAPIVPVLAGAVAAAVVVGLAWLALRGDGDDVIADGSSTTLADSTGTTAAADDGDGGADTTVDESSTSEGAATEPTTIDDVPLSDLPSGAPDSFVAVTSGTFELVRVDSRTGETIEALGSWTPDLDEGAEPGQALQRVELAPNGTIFVDDCCEPAYGSTFIVSDSFDPATTARLDGVGPEVSPDGSRLARSSLGSAISISDADGAELGMFGDPDFSGRLLTPLTWVDSSTLVVAEADPARTEDRLLVLDVSDPSSPVEISVGGGPGRTYLAADVRADGNVLVVVRMFDPAVGSSESDDVIAEIIDPATGATIADFDLPNDVYGANYDASGRFVMTVGANGQLDWYGAGQRGTLATGYLFADW